jgi:hypothetical protein
MTRDSRAGRATRVLAIAALLVGAALVLSGCLFGGDDEVTTVTDTVTPTAPEKSKQKDKKKDSKKGEGTGAAAGGACSGTEQITRLRASGVSCGQAISVAKRWQRRVSQCNTIDDPGSPIGLKRTCTVSGFKCTATRDRTSDERDVRCTRGSARITYTYLP